MKKEQLVSWMCGTDRGRFGQKGIFKYGHFFRLCDVELSHNVCSSSFIVQRNRCSGWIACTALISASTFDLAYFPASFFASAPLEQTRRCTWTGTKRPATTRLTTSTSATASATAAVTSAAAAAAAAAAASSYWMSCTEPSLASFQPSPHGRHWSANGQHVPTLAAT